MSNKCKKCSHSLDDHDRQYGCGIDGCGCSVSEELSDMRRRVISISGVSELYGVATFEECEVLDAIVDRLAMARMAEGDDK